MDKIHIRVKALRASCQYKQEYVAMVLGISQQTYSLYELNKLPFPSRHIIELAKLYHVSTDYILGAKKEIAYSISPDAAYDGNITYGNVLDTLLSLSTDKRRNALNYLTFLLTKYPPDNQDGTP